MSSDFEYKNGGCFISHGAGKHAERIIDSFELIIVVSGALDMFEEKQNFHLHAGDRLLLVPGRRHGGLTSYAKNLVFQWHHFLPRTARAERYLKAIAGARKLSCPETAGALCEILLTESKLREVYPEKQTTLDAVLTGLLNESAMELPALKQDISPLAEKAETLLRLHFQEKISTAWLAREIGCSPDYLGRVFFAARKMSLGKALRKIRIAHATELMEVSRMTIKETAWQCGYADLSYFHKQFLRETGVTPAAWRSRKNLRHMNTE